MTSALDGGESSAARPGRFTSREGTLGTLWMGGRVGPRAVLDAAVSSYRSQNYVFFCSNSTNVLILLSYLAVMTIHKVSSFSSV